MPSPARPIRSSCFTDICWRSKVRRLVKDGKWCGGIFFCDQLVTVATSNTHRKRRGFRAQVDVGQQQRSFYAPSACRDLGHGVVAAGISAPQDERAI
jgi:hypothetical protein